jgi:hypothetical protein
MTHRLLPHRAWRAARLRDLARLAAFALPWLAAIAELIARAFGLHAAAFLACAGGAIVAGIACWQWRRRDLRWLLQALNARADFEDSADLLLAADTPLQRLQQARLRQRLATHPADLRAPWPGRALAASMLAAAALLAAACLWPAPAPNTAAPAAVALMAATDAPIRLRDARLDIQPPAYTRLPARRESTLSIQAPQGAHLRWSLRFSGQPSRVALVFLDGRRLTLRHADDAWIGERSLDASALYRIEIDGRAPVAGKPHRLDAIADRPPQLRVLAPTQSLTLASPNQRTWALAFEARDDYGVANKATLRITLAQGSGENITFHERSLSLRGQGSATLRRFAHAIDLASLGLAQGDDLIVQLRVDDNRSPQPHTVRSPSLILRLQAAPGSDGSGIEGIVKRVLPAYFRSQRQIIIDAEALQKKRRTLDAERFLRDSDAIGVDQRILRLRYGQFLGEEAEGKPSLPVADGNAQDDDAGQDGHAHAAPSAATTLGRDADVLEAFGHTHDHAEAATLLDPDTRAILKQALDQMWQSELQLRQGQPDRALPYAYKALGFIKQVQQASRIYLARVGNELPPIDESRRLGGKRDGLATRPDPLRAAVPVDADLAALWRGLDERPGIDVSGEVARLQGWLRAHPGRAADPLALQAALDAVQRDPACVACRGELRGLLWALLPQPPAKVQRRLPDDAQGRRYLDALDDGGRR